MSQLCEYCGAHSSNAGPHHKWSCPRYAPDSNIRRRLLVKASALTGFRLPISRIRMIHIEPIAACNLRCEFCQVPGWERAKTTRPMTLSLFTAILDQFPGLRRIKLQGMGEPLLNKELTACIRLAHSRQIQTVIVSNGTLLSPDVSRQLFEAGLTDLTISFDGATQQTYEASRLNAHYDEVVANITAAAELKKRLSAVTKIRLSCLVSNQQVFSELPDWVKLAAKTGMDGVMIKKRLKLWNKDESSGQYSFQASYLDDFPDYVTLLERAKQVADDAGIAFKIAHDSDYSPSYPCRWPFDSLYVATEGKIVPCCVIAMPETWCMGDLTKESLAAIWNNQAYRRLRRQICFNQIPKTCKDCYRS